MVETEVAAIPYERQQDADGNRMCGAAALCMVYRSFGVECTQAEVWQAVAGGTRSARTRLICADSLQRGFDALIVRREFPGMCSASARGTRSAPSSITGSPSNRPTAITRSWWAWTTVGRWSRSQGRPGSQPGPNSVAPALATERAGLGDHRPGPGGDRRREHATVVVCSRCRAPIPESARCGRCAATIRLQPAAVLGCVAEDCDGRLWEALFCPQCDTTYRNQITPAGDEPV